MGNTANKPTEKELWYLNSSSIIHLHPGGNQGKKLIVVWLVTESIDLKMLCVSLTDLAIIITVNIYLKWVKQFVQIQTAKEMPIVIIDVAPHTMVKMKRYMLQQLENVTILCVKSFCCFFNW